MIQRNPLTLWHIKHNEQICSWLKVSNNTKTLGHIINILVKNCLEGAFPDSPISNYMEKNRQENVIYEYIKFQQHVQDLLKPEKWWQSSS